MDIGHSSQFEIRNGNRVMKEPLVSVIVPVYNSAKYLERCLASITNQSYKKIEIICINDGSTDNSLALLNEIAKSDARIAIISQQNAGLSAARNKGISVSTGEYLSFIDSDDYVAPDYIEYLLKLLERHKFKSPLAICSLMDVYTKTGKKKNTGNNQEWTLTGKQCLKMMCYHNLVDTCAYAKLGKRELYTSDFFPVGKLFEDIGSTYKLFEKAELVECGFKPKYYYCIRPNSIVTGDFSPSKLDLLEMTDRMAKSVLEYYPDLKQAVKRRQVYARFSTLNQTLGHREARKYQNAILDYLTENKRAVLTNPHAPRRDHLAYFFLNFGLPIYKIIWNMYERITK